MALLANQLMDARILGSMNGRVELSQFLRVTNQSIVSQVNSAQDDSRKNRKYPCPLCGKRFRFNSILSLHMRTHTGEKPFKCPYCDHRAAQKGNLKIHLRTHKQGLLGKGRGRIREENRLLHELEERAILRDRQIRAGHVSQPQTSTLPQLKNPQLSPTTASQLLTNSGAAETQPHTSTSPAATTANEEPAQNPTNGFRCSFCKGKFRKKQELERHIRILHKPYKCTLCDFAASQEEELIGHVEIAHITADSSSGPKPASGPSEKGKPVGEFPCDICGQTFSQAWFLKGHMRKHKDSFEHCCQICGRRFKEPWFLKNHMKVHLNKLAAKSNLSADHDSFKLSSLSQDHQSNLYSQYMSRIHNRFLMSERADHPDYNQILATAGVDMKVREMLGRMISSGPGPLSEADSSSLLGLNHFSSPLSSTSMEYLQKVMSNRDALNSSSSIYPGWQIMTPGIPSDQQMFNPKDLQPQQQQQQRSPYLPEKCLPADDGKACLSDPDTKVTSRPGSTGSASHPGTAEIFTETGSSLSSGALDHRPQSSSPAAGEKVYRCPVSSDYSAAQTASLGFHMERYNFPHWQNSRDLSSPLQPSGGGGGSSSSSSSSSNSSPNTKLRPRSREDWSPAAGHYLGLENHGDGPLLLNKQTDLADKDPGVDGSPAAQTRKSQYEPLDLSVRPEAAMSHSAMSPAVAAQMADIISNGLPSSITQQSQSYSELNFTPAYQGDLLTKGTKEESGAEKEASACNSVKKEPEKSEQGREEEMDDVAKWQILKNNVLEQEEVGHANSDYQGLGEKLDKSGQWGRGVAEFPISSLESLTPGQADPLQYQSGLLSFFRSQGNLSTAPARVHKDILNGGGNLESDVASAPKPFQCRYCPYSASQKGNLKTHVVCVHRRPFDNSLYPDRRLRRSHAPQRASRLPPTIAGDNRASGRDQIGVTSLCGT